MENYLGESWPAGQRSATPRAPNWWRHVPKFKRSVNGTRVDSFSSSRMTNTDDGVSGAGRRREPRGRHHVCVLAARRKRARSTHEFTFDMCDYRTRREGEGDRIQLSQSSSLVSPTIPLAPPHEFVKWGRKIAFRPPVSLLFSKRVLRLKI